MKALRYLLLVISLTLTAQAELSVTLQPVETSRFIYEPLHLLLKADEPMDRPTIPDGATYSITGVRPDGDGFQIELIAHEAGMLTLPPFTVTAGEQTIQTPLLRLPVAAPRRADEMEISVAYSATDLLVGQPVKMTVTWQSRESFTRCQDLLFSLPLLSHPDWEAYPLDPGVPEEQRIGLPVNAQRMIAQHEPVEKAPQGTPGQLQFSFQLIARTAGSFRSTAQLNCALLSSQKSSSQYPSYFDNHFFNIPGTKDRFERIYLSATESTLAVKALPEAGRTTYYSGIIGSCNAIATVQPDNPVVGQPMLLTLTLTELPFSAHIRNLPEATLNGLGSEFQISMNPLQTATDGLSKSFTYIIRPLRSGISTLPALAFQIFDPEAATYRTVRTAPLPITVDPDGERTVYTPSKETEPLIPQAGIRNNRKEREPPMYAFLEFLTVNGWIFWLMPPLLWLMLRPWFQRRDRCRIDPAYARAVLALRRFNRNMRHDKTTAWKIYLADRFDLTPEAVTYDAVKPHLRNLSPELQQAVRERFKEEETKHYAPPGTPPQRTAAVRKLVRKLEKSIPVLILLAALIPSPGESASADELFDRAMEIRAERPDEAAPLFMEAALEFEAESRFFNAANSWFFAGKNGRALANYRAAESRRPFDHQIRESIAFIHSQRADSFQNDNVQSFASHGKRVWRAFCRWSPSLRFGLLTLMYLVAWAAFLTLRIFGKTIRRNTWIIYGVLSVLVTISLAWSSAQSAEGVVIQPVEARLGPGYAYDTAYSGILHEATEFKWLVERNGWVHVRLPDGEKAWLRETACVKIH